MPLRGQFLRFLGNRSGSGAPMFALAALPLLSFVGAAIDFSRAASARTAMQAALDASALMLSKDAQTLSGDALGQKADKALPRMRRGQPDLTGFPCASSTLARLWCLFRTSPEPAEGTAAFRQCEDVSE